MMHKMRGVLHKKSVVFSFFFWKKKGDQKSSNPKYTDVKFSSLFLT